MSRKSRRAARARSRAELRREAGNGLWRRLRWPLSGILAVFAYGGVGYALLGFNLLDALYMTTLALTTAGFNPVGDLGPGAKAFTISIAIFGVSLFLAVLAIITSAITEGHIGIMSRRRRMERRIDAMTNHYVICAYGRVGRAVAREFEAEGAQFVVIDVKEELEEPMRIDGVVHLIGDPTLESTLRRAGIERARGLVSAVDSDAANVYITLIARSLNPRAFITARAGEPESADLLYRAGANRVVSPYVTSGRHMAHLTLRPRVLDYLEVIGVEPGLRLEELIVEEGSPLVGRTLEEACGEAVPLMLFRASGDPLPNPSGNEVVGAGDLMLLFGPPKALRPVEGD